LLILAAVILVVWLGRWIREVTYRWIYARIVDLGARHSLSVFTQYAVVVVGLLITLRLLGIDLTTLAIFAGALGVGIGFGLQNIANNLVSGILLLIERPLRSGDIINIGNREGLVTRMGMRSLTIKNWDYQDVIIPNSEIIGSAFINWTHSDNVLRTKLTLGVSYDNDPYQAKQVIEQVLKAHPAVLKNPAPAVWLSDLGSSSVNFHVQYYFDLKQHNGLEVKSQILFNLWDRLKAAGIRIPYSQQDLYIKELPDTIRVTAASEDVTPVRRMLGSGSSAVG
jgi:potassium efflux system protein